MVRNADLPEVEKYIQNGHFPSRLRLVLYIYEFPGQVDCVMHYNKRGSHLGCLKESVYPINRLRNLAINIRTYIQYTHSSSHFLSQ